MKKHLRFLLPALLALVCFSGVAQAGCGAGAGYPFPYGLGYGGFGYGLGIGGFGGVTLRNYTPPYFSLHPPVYYGQRYSRPYGVSPFPAPSQIQANPNYAPRPHVNRAKIIRNPYGDCQDCGTPIGHVVVNRESVQPQIIENPYFNATPEGQADSVRYTANRSAEDKATK